MKSTTYKYLLLGGFVLFLVACSTKKNTFVSRNSHALSTKYNILYNGGIALDKGVIDLKSGYGDNYWEILPVERMQVSKEAILPGQTRNTNFERAEEKATKSIQKHSMNIDGGEKNPQMDEAHLMLGKSRYYDQRFVPALEAFNYVLYKYPSSDKIYEVKIWREKTNMRLENDALAVTNLTKLLKEIKFKDQIFADANATLAQAFLNLKENDSAVAKLKLAREFTKENEEKARYNFILGQVYESVGYKDSAYAAYQNVIDMNRKSARQYVIHAHIRQSKQFDYEKGDTLAFIKKYKGLLKDRENRPFLDVLNHEMGLFYDKNKKYEIAQKYYNTSLKSRSQDTYLIASNYRNLADINFNNAKYVAAGKYYDSTLTNLKPRTREFNLIKKKRENLVDVIKYEAIAQVDDSILKVASLSDNEKESYYQTYIEKLKKEDEKAKLRLEKEAASAQNQPKEGKSKSNNLEADENASAKDPKKPTSNNNVAFATKAGDFYFYNANTVAIGKKDFLAKWGKRTHGANWRLSGDEEKGTAKEDEDNNSIASEETDARYTTDYYIKQIPTDQTALDSISKERNFAYFQLGVIYKEKFKEYKLAANKLETLLENNPEERLILPSMYNLYKLYEILDKAKSEDMKNQIVSKYPESRYAQLLSNNAVTLELGSPEDAYNKLFKEYEKGNYRETLIKTDIAIVQFTGEEMLPKYELLKANLIGKLYGLTEYKKALNFVALTYPNTEEGKATENFIATRIPTLEALYFNDALPTSWKIIYQPKTIDENDSKPLLEKLNKFAKERSIDKLIISTDIYTKDRNLIVIHGSKTEEIAKGIAQVLKEYKEYKIPDATVIMSSENYKVVQVFKNLEEFIAGTGPTFEAKQKPEIVLPKEEVKEKSPEQIKKEQEEMVNKKGLKEENTKNLKDNNQPNDSNDGAPNLTPPTMPSGKRG
ncbi:MAG: gliding motility protein [Bacteroidota bacterium]